MNFLEAKTMLSPYVENGTCANKQVVGDTINEAIVRLGYMGDYIGYIARYGVTVNQVDGTFTLPDALDTDIRFSELISHLPHSPAGIFITDTEQAFVLQSLSLLTTRQVGPRTWKILGKLPKAVDIMGRKTTKNLVNNSDILPINDFTALKLMCKGIWAESANQLEIGDAYIKRAAQHMQGKTDACTADVRKVTFTQIQETAPYGTLGYIRAAVALAVTEGLRLDDHKLIEVINSAVSRLMSQVQYWESGMVKVKSGLFSLPGKYRSVLGLSINNVPMGIKSQWSNFTQSGIGYREDNSSPWTAVFEDFSPLHTNLTGNSRLTFVALENEHGLDITIHGENEFGDNVEETVYITGGGPVRTEKFFSKVTGIGKPISVGAISVLMDDGYECAYMDANDQNSEVARYMIPQCTNCGERIVRVIARPKFMPAHKDSELLPIKNIPAITAMVQAIFLERIAKDNFVPIVSALEGKALKYIEKERLNDMAAHETQVHIQQVGFGKLGFGR